MILSIFNNLLRLLAGLAFGYQIIVFYFFLFQKDFTYAPERTHRNPARFGMYKVVDEMIKSEDGTNIQVWFGRPEGNLPVIVYFPAGAGGLDTRKDLFKNLVEYGYGLLAVSYRGYGRSGGTPGEQGIYADSRAAVKFAKSVGISVRDMIFYGESLGASVAAQMAIEYKPRMVVIESPLTSVPDLLQMRHPYIPAHYVIWDSFDALSRIKKVSSPVLMIHGTRDKEVPDLFTKILINAAKEPKKAIFFAGRDHLEIPGGRIAQEISSFEDELALVKDGHYSKIVKK